MECEKTIHEQIEPQKLSKGVRAFGNYPALPVRLAWVAGERGRRQAEARHHVFTQRYLAQSLLARQGGGKLGLEADHGAVGTLQGQNAHAEGRTQQDWRRR